MTTPNPKVDGYLRKNKRWQKELEALRRIILTSRLSEDVKWRHPCYTFENKNVLIIGAFKDYCALTFIKGALLNDTQGVLRKPGENTQSSRVIRFTDAAEIVKLEPVVKAYIDQAIDMEKSGQKVKLKTIAQRPIPEEFQQKFAADAALKAAFKALTPGRQRAYLLYVASAKQSKTRVSRVEKCRPQILIGKGLDD